MDADVVQKMSFDDGSIAPYYTSLCPQQRCEFIHLSPHYGRHQWNIDKNEIEKHIRRRDANPAKCQGRRIYNRQEYIAESWVAVNAGNVQLYNLRVAIACPHIVQPTEKEIEIIDGIKTVANHHHATGASSETTTNCVVFAGRSWVLAIDVRSAATPSTSASICIWWRSDWITERVCELIIMRKKRIVNSDLYLSWSQTEWGGCVSHRCIVVLGVEVCCCIRLDNAYPHHCNCVHRSCSTIVGG